MRLHPEQTTGDRQQKAVTQQKTQARQPDCAHSDRHAPLAAAPFHGVDHRACRHIRLHALAGMLMPCLDQPGAEITIGRVFARHRKPRHQLCRDELWCHKPDADVEAADFVQRAFAPPFKGVLACTINRLAGRGDLPGQRADNANGSAPRARSPGKAVRATLTTPQKLVSMIARVSAMGRSSTIAGMLAPAFRT